jgi:Zn-dependent protease with chaperone function
VAAQSASVRQRAGELLAALIASPPTPAQPQNNPPSPATVPPTPIVAPIIDSNAFDLGGFDIEDDLGVLHNKEQAAPQDDFFGVVLPPAEVVAFVAPQQHIAPVSSEPTVALPLKTPISAPATPSVRPTASAAPTINLALAASQRRDPKARLTAMVRQQIKGRIPKQRIDSSYGVSLPLAAIFVLTLPVIYVGLIFACVSLMHYYVTEVVPSLMTTFPRGQATLIAIALYTGPVMLGSLIILFMIKPIFSTVLSTRDFARERSLNREHEPLLFELVDQICEVTGAPHPKRINVDSNVDASASFGRGIRSLFGTDLTLTIGIPLAAGLTANQFAGVLTHEFGHFSQGASMRASYIIRAINRWFERVVEERDGIDDWLDDVIDEAETRLAFVIGFMRMFVFLTRGILWTFMMAAQLASSFLLRQMEYDADRYQIFVAGSQAFTNSSYQREQLAFAHAAAVIGIKKLLDQAIMINDLPKMTKLLHDQMTPEQRRSVLTKATQQRTGLFDTHPSLSDRVAAAEAIAAPGMFHNEQPASDFFMHYEALCQNVTQDLYRQIIDRLVDPSEMEPVEKHISAMKK